MDVLEVWDFFSDVLVELVDFFVFVYMIFIVFIVDCFEFLNKYVMWFYFGCS